MKIAILGHKRVPSRLGGIEVVVGELAARMAAKGHDVYVYNRSTGEPKNYAGYENIHFIEIPTFKRSSLNAIVYAFLATLHVIFHSYDVVHYHAEGPSSMIPLAKLFGKKTVSTIHGLDWQQAKWKGFAVKYLKFGEKTAAKHADRLIVLSKSAARYFKETYGTNATVIPNGITYAERREPRIITKYNLGKHDYILFLARITPAKGLDYLLDAFAELKTEKRLVIAGGFDTADYAAHIKEKASRDSRVCLVGFVHGEELAELFTNCFLYVLPSDVEGMPVSLLEAINFGARVLVSDIEPNVECLGGYGHTFKHGSYEDLRDKLEMLLSRENMADVDFKDGVSSEEVKKVETELLKKYDWDFVTDKTLEVYSEIINKK